MMAFIGAKHFKAKDGTDWIGDPVDPNNIFRGDKGLYCSLTLMDNKRGVDEWGWEGFATVDLGKDRRMAGERGPVLGNWKTLEVRSPNQNNGARPPLAAMDDSLDADDDIPF